jgi:anthranilate synthase/aminodeoxychorismate synthase-like glutamine amidotransferase
MLLLIDNYDSFTYNLAQYFGELGEDVKVVRNDAITVEAAAALRPARLVISPGPGNPTQAGVSNALLKHFHDKIPVLGVCLGHQCLAHVFGGDVVGAPRLMHGKVSDIRHDGRTIYAGLPNPFPATRYHSLIVKEETLPKAFEVTARTPEGEVMGIRMKGLPVEGVQFHPESVLTTQGKQLLRNFLGLKANAG